LDFKNGTRRPMVAYDDGIFINPDDLMGELRTHLEGKVTFVQRKINSFDELEESIVVNCTGLGARELNNDEKVVSVQGHLIPLKNQVSEGKNIMILAYLDKHKTKAGFPAKRLFYDFPKRHLNSQRVIGGTIIEGADASTPHPEECVTMLDGAREFYGVK
jgi:D-amino-acid oxidase